MSSDIFGFLGLLMAVILLRIFWKVFSWVIRIAFLFILGLGLFAVLGVLR